MRRTVKWFVVLSLVLVSVVTPYLAGAQDDQKFPILLSTGIPAADNPEDVLPAGAMVYLRVNHAQTLLENLDSLLTTLVPEKAVPPEMQPFLEKPQPFIAFLGMQMFGQELTAANLADVTGIAINRPASIALYPLPQTKGLVISVPVANASLVSQMVESMLTPEAFEKGTIGDITYYHVTPPSYKIPTDLYILASEKTIFFCGSIEVAEMLVNAGNIGLLTKDPVIPKAVTKYGNRDLTLILSPGMFKEQLPAMQAQFAEILTPVFLQVRAQVQQMPPEERLLLDARLRLQFGIDGLDQLVDYAEAYATGIYRVVFERLVKVLTDLDGLAFALDVDKEFQTAALSFFSQGIAVDQLPRPLPVEDVKKALNALPGEKGIVVALGQSPGGKASPLATAILDAIEAELRAKGLPLETFAAMKAFQTAKQHQTPLSAQSAWMLKTIVPLADKFDFSQFDSLEALFNGVSRWAAAQPMAMSVTVMPAVAAGALEQYFAEQARIITQNGQNYKAMREKLPFQQPIVDSSASFQQEDAGAGMKKLTLDHIYTTRGGLFGYQQHALVNRRIMLHQQKDGYDVLYATGADVSRLKPIIEGQSAAPVAIAALFDRAPAGALAVSTFRALHGIAMLLDGLTGVEDVAHRELDAFLTKTQEIVKTSGTEDLAAQFLNAKLAPPLLLMSLNLDGEGNVYAVLPGGLHYPRPMIMPKVKELFTDFLAKAPEVGGTASFVAAQPGEFEFSSVQSTAGLALLVKTVVNAFYDAYMTTPEGQEQLFSTLMHPSDFQPIEEEEIFVNPLWESLKNGEGLPILSDIQRAKRTRTMADMISLGTALASYQVDQNYYPKYPEAMYLWDIELPSEYYEGSYSDGWEMPFNYLSDADGLNYLLLSYGKDGMPGSEGGGGVFDADIMYMNGMFIAPEEAAGGFMEAELNTALLLAVQANAYDVTDALLMSGASPDAQNADGKSALAIATELEFSDIVDLLTEAGATE